MPAESARRARRNLEPGRGQPPERLELRAGVWLDARGAAWLSEERVLAVADLHLGYVWAQREAGQLLPLCCADDTLDRLEALRVEYRPAAIVLLGDVVHRALALAGIRSELRGVIGGLESKCEVRLIAGNHDKDLGALVAALELSQPVEVHARIGPHLLVHGDDGSALAVSQWKAEEGGMIIMGHEHPAIALGDGITAAMKCPCFLAGPEVLVLPAFSRWAAGSPVSPNGSFLSSVARQARLTEAIAMMGHRLLRVPLPSHFQLGPPLAKAGRKRGKARPGKQHPGV
jgi:uncharacterized protein